MVTHFSTIIHYIHSLEYHTQTHSFTTIVVQFYYIHKLFKQELPLVGTPQ